MSALFYLSRKVNSSGSGRMSVVIVGVILLLSFVSQIYTLSTSHKNPRMFVVKFEEENPKNQITPSKSESDWDMDLSNFLTNAIDEREVKVGFLNDRKRENYLTTPEMIQKAGYPAESHTVKTADGYILTMHRIPYGKVNGSMLGDPKRVIFLQHGMFGTSADWILNSVEKSLAYMLADSGYDVWFGNARGNEYSTNHETFSPNFFKFWKFSWHEMGYYDLPAELDYVLNKTGRTDLYYTGHSMGTTMFFVLMSTRPEYNQKIKVMNALGPAVYLNHAKSSITYFAKNWGRVEKIFLDIVGNGILLPKLLTKMIHYFAPEACTPELEVDKLCDWIIALLAGHDPAQTNYTQLPTILAHEPSTISSHTAFHFFQNIKSGYFRMYDEGFHKTDPPPEYDLSKVAVPVALYWGPNDFLCDPIDVARLSKKLPNVVLNFQVNFTKFNHVDFLFAKDVDILVNKPLIKFLEKY